MTDRLLQGLLHLDAGARAIILAKIAKYDVGEANRLYQAICRLLIGNSR